MTKRSKPFVAEGTGLALALLLTGCASYPRLLETDAIDSGTEIMRKLNIDQEYTLVGIEALRGNTVRSEIKVFITDKSVNNRYFGTDGLMFYQDEPMVAYGFIPLPTQDKDSEGYLAEYRSSNGVILTELCGKETEQLLVTRRRLGGDYACWLNSRCVETTPFRAWQKWDCTIESGNSLRAQRRR